MRIKQILFEDFIQYKKCSMFIGTAFCDWKCCKEAGCAICQNLPLANAPIIDMDNTKLVAVYMNNPLTEAIVFGGLEPMDQFDELVELINEFRKQTKDPIIIYTGYNKEEISEKIQILKKIPCTIIKFGRFIPNSQKIFDKVLGVILASDNQYAELISDEY